MDSLHTLKEKIGILRKRAEEPGPLPKRIPDLSGPFENGLPQTVQILINDSCNLRCKMCFKWKTRDLPEEHPNMKVWQGLFFDLATLLPPRTQILFSGGELLLSDQLFTLIEIAKSNGFRTHLPSNGWLLNQSVVERLARAGLDDITLSLDSLDPSVHDFTRGRSGVHVRVIRAIETIKRFSSIGVGIGSIIMQPNLEGIIDLTEWVISNQLIENINFQALTKPTNIDLPDHWYELHEYKELWPSDLPLLDLVLDYLGDCADREKKVLNRRIQFEYFRRYFKNPANFIRKTPCAIDRAALNFNQRGDVFFCLFHGELGNLKKRSLLDILKDGDFSEQRRSIKACKENCHSLINCNFRDMEW